MRKQLILSVGVVIVMALVLLQCGKTTEYGKETAKTKELEILESHMDEEYDVLGLEVYVRGTAKNIGEKQLSYASVKAKFYDANNTLLYTGSDSINDLDAGETWSFEIWYLGDEPAENVASYTIAVGSCW